MSFWNEFKAFVLKGNMMDLAIGIIIGAAFSKVVSSLVSDIIMPPFGLILGGVDFSQFSVNMHLPGSSTPPVEWKYGLFLTSLLNLLIVAGAIFLVIKALTVLKKEKPTEKESTVKLCPECKMEIPKDAHKCGPCCSVLETNGKDH
jgi:large conductance mechanosensitive channel